MTNIYELERRFLVPNWRDFRRTVKIGELGLLHDSKKLSIDKSGVLLDWQNNKTIGVAADLINRSFILNDLFSTELQDAIRLVEENILDASNPLLSLINQIKDELNPEIESSTKVLEKNITSIDEFNSIFDEKLFNKIISKTKNKTKNHLNNAIYWVELARLYTIKGHLHKAEKSMIIALNLASENRFVLRSATRFFIHNGDEERALYYLRKTSNIKNDPWLISAHIASSQLINRFSPFIKNGFKLIESKNLSLFDITELSSSLGSLELENGSFKKAKPLLDISISCPNDNSLAQFEWLSKRDGRLIFNTEDFDKVINPFEAFAYENFKKGNFKKSFYNCIDWFLDIPFSKRPLMFASYIATILGEHDKSIMLCMVGLRYDNNEIGFVNNLVYNYCIKNDLVNANKYLTTYLSKNPTNELTNEVKVTLQATIGLFLLRSQRINEGKKIYKSALDNSLNLKNNYYYNLVLINLTRELHYLKDDEFDYYYEKFKSLKSEDKDVIIQKESVEKIIVR
ncbi:hypothetical protein KSK37_05850 [Kaistella sp. DKR-2]|uniref:hypothetical protein n=1 Tax=Kaistella soli TaxID=2849654 RepID=UPI001C26BF9E|nr:hypothetical protein [Kaistella soli]MBU8882606.1 hypothetical protein [Kaistella soli]